MWISEGGVEVTAPKTLDTCKWSPLNQLHINDSANEDTKGPGASLGSERLHTLAKRLHANDFSLNKESQIQGDMLLLPLNVAEACINHISHSTHPGHFHLTSAFSKAFTV